MATIHPLPEELHISHQAHLEETLNLTQYFRQRNVSLAQHLINRDATIKALKVTIRQLEAQLADGTPASEASEVPDGE